MPTEELSYAQMAERLSVSTEAARALVKRHHLPRSRSNDGKTLVAVDLGELHHRPLPGRSSREYQAVTDLVATLKARIATLEADLAAEQQRSAGHRADFERECERADRMVAIQDRLIAELEKISALFWKRHSNLPDRSPPGLGVRCLRLRDGAGCARPGETTTALRPSLPLAAMFFGSLGAALRAPWVKLELLAQGVRV